MAIDHRTGIEALQDKKYKRDQFHAVVAHLGGEALSGVELPKLMEDIVSAVAECLNVEHCHVLELLPAANALRMIASTSLNGSIEQGQIDASPSMLPGYTLQMGQLQLVQDFREETRLQCPDLPGTKGALSAMSVPVQGQTRPFGVLEVYAAQPKAFISIDLDFLYSLANVLAAAINQNRYNEELRALNESLDEQVAERTRLAHLIQEVTVVANEAFNTNEAMRAVLDKICAYTGWPLGHVYVPGDSENAPLQSTSLWFIRDPERFESFRQVTQQTHFPPGVGLPGRVFQTGRPEWVTDLSVEGLLRVEQVKQSGLKAAFGFPVLVGAEVVAILEFFTDEVKQPDHLLLNSLANIGVQIGRVVERRRILESLEASQRRLAEAQHLARLGSWEWDIPENRVSWSETLYEVYGLKSGEFNATYEGYLERVLPEDRDRVKRVIERAYNQPAPFEFEHRIVLPDGTVRSVQARGEVIADETGKPVKMTGTSQDITELKRMEEELQAREKLLRLVVTSAPIIFWAIDRDGMITLVEGRGLSALGVAPGALVGTSIYGQLTGIPQVQDAIQKALKGKEVTAEIETEAGIFETRYSPIIDEHAEIVGVAGISLNVTERVRADAALRESEARFRTIFEGSANGISVLDLQHRFVLANPTLVTLLGYTDAELRSMDLWKVIHPIDRVKNRVLLEAVVAGERDIVRAEVRFLRRDRTLFWVNLSVTLVRNMDGTPRLALAMAEDITTRKQMEAELAEVQRQLVASGEKERLHLAQELHDEPLQDLYGLIYQFSFLEEALAGDERRKELEDVHTSLNHIVVTLRAICGELRPPTLTPFGLEGAIREHAEQFQHDHPDLKLELDLMFDGQTLPEHLRLTLFRIYQQAMSNVARHAQASNVTVRFRYDDVQAELEVEDDGLGFHVPARWVELVRQDHLGLAGAAERVELVNGHLQVASSPGKGTLFRVNIPLTTPVEETLTE